MAMAPERAVPLLCLDLDGTVRQGKDDALGRFVNGPDNVVVFPEAVEMMRRWKDAGGRIVGVSNQGGIALGIVTYQSVVLAIMETQRQTGNLFDKMIHILDKRDGSKTVARCGTRITTRPRFYGRGEQTCPHCTRGG
jgi:D-glycero-D-manno-heptose 1,7-bisphosphate phosphatase